VGELVTVDATAGAHGVKVCVADTQVVGVSSEIAAAGEKVVIWTAGVFYGPAAVEGTGVEEGDKVACNGAGGKVKVPATGDYIIGVAVYGSTTTTGADGDDIYMHLISDLDGASETG
jgi:predicted RecA/RadA family phage recombinase